MIYNDDLLFQKALYKVATGIILTNGRIKILKCNLSLLKVEIF